MKDQFLRDRTGHVIGRFDGQILRDGNGRIVAKFDADGYTRERSGAIVGKGDFRLFELGKFVPKK